MHVSNKILSDITVYMKYAKYIPELKRRETWEELCERNLEMHIKKYPELRQEIIDVYEKFVFTKKVLPSMRSLQFGGRPIELNNSRIYNCAYCPIDDLAAFWEMMFLLLGGTGCGYSVQRHHVDRLPNLKGVGKKNRRYLVGDSIEGWSDCIRVLLEAYFKGKSNPVFDFSDIRPKGAALITSGGKAPGPQPLKDCVHNIRKVLDNAIEERGSECKLKPIEAHDIVCHIADAVLAGGIRRAALISLFSVDDNEMMCAKQGDWWERNPQRGRANNSVVLLRHRITRKAFDTILEKVEASGSGEPGIYLSNDKDWGTNPCAEIALRPNQFCNLVELCASDVVSQEDLNERVSAGAFIATLQAGYTDFHYLRDIWKENTERDALIGVSLTGIASGKLEQLNLEQAADWAVETNRTIAKRIGINPAARCTTVKPAGTTSLVLGCSSGIHAWHNDYYLRRIRVGKNEPIYSYLKENHPELIKDEYFRPDDQAVIEIPQAAPEGATLRTESMMSLLDRVKRFNTEWVKNGHIDGQNAHNVSVTVSVKEDEWKPLGDWMWDNRESFNGISVLPYDGGTYIQAPFEDITKEQYEELESHLHSIDLSKIIEMQDNTNLVEQAACSGGACEIK